LGNCLGEHERTARALSCRSVVPRLPVSLTSHVSNGGSSNGSTCSGGFRQWYALQALSAERQSLYVTEKSEFD
jgi:hypothetical protein